MTLDERILGVLAGGAEQAWRLHALLGITSARVGSALKRLRAAGKVRMVRKAGKYFYELAEAADAGK